MGGEQGTASATLVCWCPAPLWGFFSLPADKWGAEEVAAWLETLGLGEYREIFIRHDIQGSELILLERRDLKVPQPSFPPPRPQHKRVLHLPPSFNLIVPYQWGHNGGEGSGPSPWFTSIVPVLHPGEQSFAAPLSPPTGPGHHQSWPHEENPASH